MTKFLLFPRPLINRKLLNRQKSYYVLFSIRNLLNRKKLLTQMKNQIYGKMWNVYIYIAFSLGYCILYTWVKLFSCVVKWQLVGIIRLRLHLPTHDQGEAGRGLRVPQIRRTTSATTAVTLWSTDLTTGYISPSPLSILEHSFML